MLDFALCLYNLSAMNEHIVSSPCIGLCQRNADNYCIGCKRHIHEIRDWIKLTNDEKRRLVELLKTRKVKDL